VGASVALLFFSPGVLVKEALGQSPTAPASGNPVPFAADLQPGKNCVIEIAQLHPTQAAVGYFEVKLKADKLAGKSPAKLQKYLAGHPVPIVIGPGGTAYLTDHHHLARALWDGKLSPTVIATVSANWSSLSQDDFWNRMKNHVNDATKAPEPWVYLDDENGQPLSGPDALPKTIADLKDDPFRSLIYLLIGTDPGDLDKDPAPFSEFNEAQYYRGKFKEANFTFDNSKDGFDKAVVEAKTFSPPPKQ
jgi:hypothetical protein